MEKRFAFWFRQLTADRMAIRRPALRDPPFVLAAPVRGLPLIDRLPHHPNVVGICGGIVAC